LNCNLPLLLAPTYCGLLSDHSQFVTTLGHGRSQNRVLANSKLPHPIIAWRSHILSSLPDWCESMSCLNCDLPLLLAPTYCELLSDHSQCITTLGHGDRKSVFWHCLHDSPHAFCRRPTFKLGQGSMTYFNVFRHRLHPLCSTHYYCRERNRFNPSYYF
jgi:hypothetical protein